MLKLRVPEYIRALQPYVPGKPIEETRREFKLKRVIKLASNENPLGPSPKALKALLRAAKDLHRYPDGSAYRLKQALSQHFGMKPDSLFIGNGSNEIVDALIRTFCVPGDAIVTSQAAFIAYRIGAQAHGVRALESPLRPSYEFDLDAMLELVRKDERARIVFIANPNNPTGTYVESRAFLGFLKEAATIRGGTVLVALDAAYAEYVTASDYFDPLQNPAKALQEFPNLITLRTFSKIYGLAGVRVGYGVAHPEIIAAIEKVREPFNVNSLGLVAAEAALGDRAFVARSKKLNQRGMKFWEKELARLSIPFWRSQGNFLLVDTQKGLGKSGKEVYHSCLKKGVILRPVMNYGLDHALRISIGTMEENGRAVESIRAGK